MVKAIVFLFVLSGGLYFYMGQDNPPHWTPQTFQEEQIRVQFPSEDSPAKRNLPPADCLGGSIHYVDSRHGPFKMNGVLSEVGSLYINTIIFGCKLTPEGAFKYFGQMSATKYGGKITSEKDIVVEGYPGREFVIEAGFEESTVVRRIFSLGKGQVVVMGMTYPKRADYQPWADQFFNSFQFAS